MRPSESGFGDGRRAGDNVDAPLQLVRFRVEVELAAVSDISDFELASRLAGLACAGFLGMLLDVRRVELNGAEYPEARALVRQPGDPKRIRPLPDQRLVASAYELSRLTREMFAALGIALPEAAGDASEDVG